jgi:RNA polymerase sigma factor (sigma-70 family)
MPDNIESILEALAPLLISELRALGYTASSADRDDLLQEIRVRIWKVLRDREGEIFFFDAYVKKIVLSIFIREVKKRARERRLINAAGTDGDLIRGGRGHQAGSGDRLKETVIESLGTLGAAKRRALELRFEGYTFAEIARLNHWSLRKACGIYYRGIAELKDRLAKRGIHDED